VAVRPEQLDDLAELAAGDSNVPAGAEGKQRPALVLEHAELVRRLVERREGEYAALRRVVGQRRVVGHVARERESQRATALCSIVGCVLSDFILFHNR